MFTLLFNTRKTLFSYFMDGLFTFVMICSFMLSQVRSISMQPTYTPIAANIMQIGQKVIISSSTASGSSTYTVPYSQSISNPKLVLGVNKLSILFTNSPSTAYNKYQLAYAPTVTSTGFNSRWVILTSNTNIFSVVLQYMVYNNADSLISALQFTSLYSSILTQQFYLLERNYHQQVLTMDRTMRAPTNSRYYSSNPRCSALILGYKMQATEFKFVFATCTMQYGSNSANVVVYANDNAKIDTYPVSIFCFVVPQARYFGYFQDPLNYAYVSIQNSSNSLIQTNTNTSKQYLILKMNNYNRLSTSQFAIDIQNSFPSMMSSLSIPIFYSITGIAVTDALVQYSQSFNKSTNTIDLSNSQHYVQSTTNLSIIGYNMGLLLTIGTVECNTGYYYDRIGGLCYQFWAGGDRQCTGLQYIGRMDYAAANSSQDVNFVMFSNTNSIQAINSEIYTVLGYSSDATIWQIRMLTSSTPAIPTTYTSQDTNITYTESIINNTKISSSNLNISSIPNGLDSQQIMYTEDNQLIIFGGKLYHVDMTGPTVNFVQDLMIDFNSLGSIIWSQIVKLQDITTFIKDSFTGRYNISINNQSSSSNASTETPYKLLTLINSQFQIDTYIISTSQPITAKRIYSYSGSASQILTYIQTAASTSNLTSSQILQSIKVQSKSISNRITGCVLKLQTSVLGSIYDVVQIVQFIIDNYVFMYQISLNFTISTSITVLSATATLLQSQTIPVALSGTPYPVDTSQIPALYISQLTINKPNYTSIPQFFNLSHYTYLEAFYSDSYYKNRQIYLTFVLSDGQVLSYGGLMGRLPNHYQVNLSAINLTVNYSYVYDCWGDAIFDDNITTSYQYMDSPYSLYDTYYTNNSDNNYYNFNQLTITSTLSPHSTILSQLGDEGNPSSINSFGASPSAKGDQILLLRTLDINYNIVDMQMTENTLFVLANTNLLYIYEKHQLQNVTSSNKNSINNLTAFQGYQLARVVDIYKFLVEKVAESGSSQIGQIAISVAADVINGILYIGTSKGRLYKMQCGWGYKANKYDSALSLNNRQYIYMYRQLNIPPPPPNITNTTNSTNTTNTTNSTNSTIIINNNSSTNTTNSTTNSSTIIQPPVQPQAQATKSQQLPQTTIIIISVVCGVLGIVTLIAIYWIFISPTKVIKVNPQMVTKVKNATRTSFDDFSQIGDKTQYRVQRLSSGKTEGNLLQFQSSGSQANIQSSERILNIKRTKQLSLNSLQIKQDSSRSPYGSGQRGLIKQKDRVFIVQDIEE